MEGVKAVRILLATLFLIGICFGALGDVVWKTQWNYSTGFNQVAYGTCTDGQYVYVVGYTLDEGDGDYSGSSALIAKIDPKTGSVLATIRYEPYDDSADDDWDYLYDCVIVGDYLYVVGTTYATGSFGRHIAKIDLTTFTKVAEYNLDYYFGNSDYWFSIDSDGTYLYVAGYYYTGAESYFIVQKLDLNGNVLATWTADGKTAFGCRAGSDLTYSRSDILTSIQYYNGYVYVGGRYGCKGDWGGDGYSDDYDYRVVAIKLNASDLTQVSYYVKDLLSQNFEGDQWEYIYGLYVDDSGVYITGHYLDGLGGNYHAFLIKLDHSLNELATITWLSDTSYSAHGAKLFRKGNSVLVFSKEYAGGHYHQTLRIFDTSLALQNTITLNSGAYNSYFFIGKVGYYGGYVYVAGSDYANGIEWTIYKIEVASLTITINQPADGSWLNTINVDVNWKLDIYEHDVNLEQKILVDNDEIWSDTNYYYIKYYKITITNPNNYDLTNYQVKIDLSAYSLTQYLKVCADEDCTQLLEFCYEQDNGECNTTFSRIIWVKVPNIPANGSVVVYIFDREATNYATTGENVFDFYDDFETWNGWVQYGNGVISRDCTTFGYCTLKKSSYGDPNGGYKDLGFVLDYPFVFEVRLYRSYLSGANADRLGVVDNYGRGYGIHINHDGDELKVDLRNDYYAGYGTYLKNYYPDYVSIWYRLKWYWNNGNMGFYYMDDYGNIKTSATYYHSSYSAFTRVYVFGGYTYFVDWIRIRKFADQEPTINIDQVSNLDLYFQQTITLSEGAHTITVQATNLDTNETVSQDVNITVDLTPPTVQIDINLPADGFYTTIPSASAKINSNDNLSPTIHCDYKINGAQFSGDFDAGSSTTQNFQPVDGNNIVIATCNDLAGNETTVTVHKWFYKKYIKALDEFSGSAINLAIYDSVIIQALGNNVLDQYDMKANNVTEIYYAGETLPEVFRIVATQGGSQFYREMKADYDTNINIYLVDLNAKQLSQTLFKIVSYVGYDCYVKVYKPDKVIYFGPINQVDYSYLTYLVNNETYYVDVLCGTVTYSKGWITVYGAATYTLLINQVTVDETVSQIYKYISYSLDINTDLNTLIINVASLDANPVTVKAVIYEDTNKVYDNTITNTAVQITIPCDENKKYRVFLTITHPKVGTIDIVKILAFPQYLEEVFPNIDVYKWGSLLLLLGVTALMSDGIGAGGLIVAGLSAFFWYMGWIPLTWVGIVVILIIGVYSYIRKSI